MFAAPASVPGTAYLTRTAGWAGLAAFAVFLLAGLVARVGERPAAAAAGALIALAAAVPLFLLRTRFTLGFAAVSAVGAAVLGNGDSRVISWMMVVVLAAWCVLAGGIAAGTVFGAASILLFGGEWLWTVHDRVHVHDPGWAPWSAGVIIGVLGAALIQHQFVLMERLRAAQAGLAERSRAEERNRIARDLHDVIAHSLTVSLLHVTSARLAVEYDPADAARALAEAERLGRQSLAEVRATMGLLRSEPAEGIAAPVPGADQVPRLIQQLRNAGADVALVVDGDARGLPATTGSTVYRIVQEALTNASKHAPGSPVLVTIVIHNGQADVTVDSAGPPGQGSGLGLLSMQERAQAVGGTCTAGPGGRGWLVRACLPVTAGLSRRGS
ncbi:MAG TPA: histidine kinase [Streptosporangiaceae bacterium]|nr:histidine kinase [Streptosporangiaceae bacterium]